MPAAHAERLARVARPDAGAEPVQRVVGDLGAPRASSANVVTASTGPEDLLLEDPHVVRALEDGRLEVVAVLELAAEVGALAADQQLGALLLADLDVALDLLELRGRDLRADLCLAVERVALPDRGDPLERSGP